MTEETEPCAQNVETLIDRALANGNERDQIYRGLPAPGLAGPVAGLSCGCRPSPRHNAAPLTSSARSSVVTRRNCRRPKKKSGACGSFFPTLPVAFAAVFLQRRAVGCGDRSLRRDHARSGTARNSFCTDVFLNDCFAVGVGDHKHRCLPENRGNYGGMPVDYPDSDISSLQPS
jgi:hypothetical protein